MFSGPGLSGPKALTEFERASGHRFQTEAWAPNVANLRPQRSARKLFSSPPCVSALVNLTDPALATPRSPTIAAITNGVATSGLVTLCLCTGCSRAPADSDTRKVRPRTTSKGLDQSEPAVIWNPP